MAYSHTANGELASKSQNGQAVGYQYGELGNLRDVTLPDGIRIEYVIDGQNRQASCTRASSTPSRSWTAPGRWPRASSTAPRSNVPDYLIKGGITYRIIADHLGSPRLIVNAARREVSPGASISGSMRTRTVTLSPSVRLATSASRPLPSGGSFRRNATWIGRSLRDLRLHYAKPVLASAVYLQGGRPGLRLESGVVARAGRVEVARLYFTTFGLTESRAEHFLERPEPLAWALAAWMRPTRRTPDEPRRACLERIAGPLSSSSAALSCAGA